MAEWIVEFDDKEALKRLAWAIDADIPEPPETRRLRKYRIARVKGLKVEVFADEHPPPHFRVSANGETANYRIADGEQLNGDLLRHRRAIHDWYRENKPLLIEAWNSRRPSDCPVGDYRAG